MINVGVPDVEILRTSGPPSPPTGSPAHPNTRWSTEAGSEVLTARPPCSKTVRSPELTEHPPPEAEAGGRGRGRARGEGCRGRGRGTAGGRRAPGRQYPGAPADSRASWRASTRQPRLSGERARDNRASSHRASTRQPSEQATATLDGLHVRRPAPRPRSCRVTRRV
jgi:hypothetical protein